MTNELLVCWGKCFLLTRSRWGRWYFDKVAAKSGQNAAQCRIDSSTMCGKKRTDPRVGQSGPATSSRCLGGRKRKKERKKPGDWWPESRHPSPSRQNRVPRMLLKRTSYLPIKLTTFESHRTFPATNSFHTLERKFMEYQRISLFEKMYLYRISIIFILYRFN